MPETTSTTSHRAEGQRVQKLRRLLGLTQAQVGQPGGLSGNYVTQVERGAMALRDYQQREKLAKGLGLRREAFDALWDGKVEPELLAPRARRALKVSHRNV